MSQDNLQLRFQWGNPREVLSLLLLVGGDIVQKAIAQLVGPAFRLPGSSVRLSIPPVAFSFGWVAYSFSNLLAAFGDMKLMPLVERPSLLVSCSNGFVRDNQSWILSRLLRDHELRHEINSQGEGMGGKEESIRIDIFSLGPAAGPDCDLVWLIGWVTIVVQLVISIIPWISYGQWGISLVTLSGIVLAAITGAMPQWTQEKWSASILERDKVTCLTRGNGNRHVMVFVGSMGSWNLEVLATGRPNPRPQTRWLSLILAFLWTCLLISVSGIENHTWYLLGIGGIGMLQNLFAAGTPRSPAAANLHLTRFLRAPTIIGRRGLEGANEGADEAVREDEKKLATLASWTSQAGGSTASNYPMPRWLASMSREDGVPTWLTPIEPQSGAVAAPNPLTALLARTHLIKYPSSASRDRIIYAAGVHGA
ncbi:MAG: hypothetical protein L6R38_008093 [Xanthoria sp. 2 TBL-2021]|nr:MAG: hypothetical protein L6R38_008093 [Xanthoria sp. 2 TBL-2021]